MNQFIKSMICGLGALASLSVYGQTQLSAAPKDPKAEQIAQRSLSAMGAVLVLNGQTTELTGTLALNGTNPVTYTITIRSSGPETLRSELSTKTGIRTTVISQGHGRIQKPDGSIRWLAAENLVGQRNDYVPAISLLAEYGLPGVSLDYVGTASIDGSIDDVVGLGVYSGATDSAAQKRAKDTRALFYIDRTTGFVTRVQKLHYAENAPTDSQALEIRYSDYRQVNGVSVPYRQQTYADASLVMDLTITAVQVGLPTAESDFNLNQ